MFNRRLEVITCPFCGQQYLPSEIYLPDSFLGHPKNIEKEYVSGKILDYDGKSMDTVEYYQCDSCNTKFKVVANVNFKSYTLDDNKSKQSLTTNSKMTVQKLFLPEA